MVMKNIQAQTISNQPLTNRVKNNQASKNKQAPTILHLTKKLKNKQAQTILHQQMAKKQAPQTHHK